MKLINIITFFFILFLSKNSLSQNKVLNNFLSSNDTLIIKTKKQKGDGLFQLGAVVNPMFDGTLENYPHFLKYPETVKDIELLQLKTDFREKNDYYVNILRGVKNGQKVIVVDENNNQNFADELIRPYEKVLWNSNDKLVKCTYQISNGREIIKDSSWLRIGISNNEFVIGRSEHLIGEFKIDNSYYKIGIIDPRNLSFTYNINPELALLAYQETKKDSISNRDLLKLGEFLNLNNINYKFDSISNNGEFVRLVKEKNFKSQIGTQIAMLAPTFNVITTKGDTLKSLNLNNKITIIANSCGCGGDKESTEAYYNIKKTFKNINILHADSKIKTDSDGLHIDMENVFNNDFYNNYRKEYCSRICYVIGKDNRIVDKFEITDWKNNLPKLIEE